MAETAIIIGAGPAGLTAAFELLQRTGIVPIVLEAEDYVGGISRTANYKGKRRGVTAGQGPDPEKCDQVMLLRSRKSRIYFLRKFFDYPITLSLDTIRKLGLPRMVKIGLSYLRAAL